MGAFDEIIEKFSTPASTQQSQPAALFQQMGMSTSRYKPSQSARGISVSGWRLAHSELGYPELHAPFELRKGDYQVGGVTFPSGEALLKKSESLGVPPSIVKALSGEYAQDPAVIFPRGAGQTSVNHERIHVGQKLSGYDPYLEYPEPKNMDLFMDLVKRAKAIAALPTFEGASPLAFENPTEVPAYSFSDPQRYDQQAFAAYINDVHRNAPRPYALEASMPRQIMVKYLQTEPVPYTVKPPQVAVEYAPDKEGK